MQNCFIDLYRRSFDIESKLGKYLDVFSVVLSNTIFIRLERCKLACKHCLSVVVKKTAENHFALLV